MNSFVRDKLREWPFHSESVFLKLGVVPRLLILISPKRTLTLAPFDLFRIISSPMEVLISEASTARQAPKLTLTLHLLPAHSQKSVDLSFFLCVALKS